jgi:ABC-type multidrug transport system fused ATPase/permease subunit
MTSVRMRRTLVDVMFDKVTALSLDSLQKTNSGKIITLISSDLFALERLLTFVPMVFVLPVANLFCYLLIGFFFSWMSSLIVFLCFIFAFTI